jgi:superfamily II DNA or RNA helicase
MNSLKGIAYPTSGDYYACSEHEPLEFFVSALPAAKQFNLLLGYFSSAVINTLPQSFAQFIFNGGKINLVSNHILSSEDLELLRQTEGKCGPSEDQSYLLHDYNKLKESLTSRGEHFFNCLSYLIANERISWIAVKPSTRGGISHWKSGVLYDGECSVKFRGSCNFTYYGLTQNLEELSVQRSWGSLQEQESIVQFEKLFELISSKKAPFVDYLNSSFIKAQVLSDFRVQSERKLIEDEQKLLKHEKAAIPHNRKICQIIENQESMIAQSAKTPRFPIPEGPRDYQVQAYNNWLENECHGIFAMATGTGKTMTSLNTLVEEYRKEGYYRALILVPSVELVDQWRREAERFNFTNIILVSGSYDWRRELLRLSNDIEFGLDQDFIIIATYISFTHNDFADLFRPINRNDITLIADEAHSIGMPTVKRALFAMQFAKSIALSATPQRIYDADGTKEIEKYFKDTPPYVFSLSMEEAIDKGFLCQYYYYPIPVYLDDEEQKRYNDLSLKIAQLYGASQEKSGSIADRMKDLLLARKRIVHKAKSKIGAYASLAVRLRQEGKLKYAFVYVPEGEADESSDYTRIIDQLKAITYNIDPDIKYNSILGGERSRAELLSLFADGEIDLLFAMKCLDEGVDVPRAEVGIFLSSTGNPRQFIQRRGRLLRTYNKNGYRKEHAYIYDLVVVPNLSEINEDTYKSERSLLKSELMRVANFAQLSENFHYTKEVFEEYSEYFNLNIDSIINEQTNAEPETNI